MNQIQHENRRRAERARTLKRARIILNHGYSVFDCMIRNLSDGGAMLQMADQLGVPDHFELAIGHARHGNLCTVRWRNEAARGVSFDATQNDGRTAAA